MKHEKDVSSKNNDNNADKKTDPKPPLEFKQQSLARCATEGVAVTARDLGLAESQLYAWRKQASDASSVTEDERLHLAEFAKLKRDKARLEEEVAFLKKAAAYFAQLPK